MKTLMQGMHAEILELENIVPDLCLLDLFCPIKKNVKLHPNTLSQFGVIFPKKATTTVCLAFCINPSSMPTQYTCTHTTGILYVVQS